MLAPDLVDSLDRAEKAIAGVSLAVQPVLRHQNDIDYVNSTVEYIRTTLSLLKQDIVTLAQGIEVS